MTMRPTVYSAHAAFRHSQLKPLRDATDFF